LFTAPSFHKTGFHKRRLSDDKAGARGCHRIVAGAFAKAAELTLNPLGAAGEVIGAIGISGDASDNADACAMAASKPPGSG
jgi:hypothetical protein